MPSALAPHVFGVLDGTSRNLQAGSSLAVRLVFRLCIPRGLFARGLGCSFSKGACVRRTRDVASSNGCSREHNVLFLWGGNSNVTSCGMATCRPLRLNPCPNSAFDIAWLNYIRTTMHHSHDCRPVARVAKRSRALQGHQYHHSH
jgi:hypothetical protein